MESLGTFELRVAQLLTQLGVPDSFRSAGRLPLCEEATDLVSVGLDLYGREQRLAPHAASCWQAMQRRAEQEGVLLQLVSGFRSVDYQREIWDRKLAKGQTVAEILTVNAPPGYSQHHSGLALDLTTSGVPALTEEFESTAAFRWLANRAGDFGFTLSYPRDNSFGISYEPWHWFASPPSD